MYMNMNGYINRFYNLLESQLGNVKPLLCENEIDEDKIDLGGTYLDDENVKQYKTNIKKNSSTGSESVRAIKGNQFKDATTSNNKYGITFFEKDGGSFKPIFPDEFIQKYFSLPASEVLGSLGPYGDEHGRDLPMTAKSPTGRVKSVSALLDNVDIQTEGFPENRIHFIAGVPDSLRGTGLGYIIYESFIKFLGWGSSNWGASESAKVIWSKLIQDPDFYSLFFTSGDNTSVCCIYKQNDKNISPVEIVKTILTKVSNGVNVKIKLGDNLRNDYPELKKFEDVE